MWSSTNTALPGSSSIRTALLIPGLLVCLLIVTPAHGQGPRPPDSVIAGTDFSIATAGSGKATFYLVGPGQTDKRQIALGQDIYIKGERASSAGLYLAIVCSDTCQSTPFWVKPAAMASLSFLVHPSRVPVQADNAVSGVVVPYDRFRNLVLTPVTVNFRFDVGSTHVAASSASTQNGVAWFRTRSGRAAGAGQIFATAGNVTVRRVVQEVASDPCNLRIKAQRTAKGILLETEPVRDCAGNPVPDGTIVTFSKTDAIGKSTVDSPIKQGVARAQMTGSSAATISVASGVVMGNPIRVEQR